MWPTRTITGKRGLRRHRSRFRNRLRGLRTLRSSPVWKSKFYDAFVLNHIVVLHAIDATPARWRGDAGSSPLDGTSAATPSPGNDLVKNCRVHPTHWLLSTQVQSGGETKPAGPTYAELVALAFAAPDLSKPEGVETKEIREWILGSVPEWADATAAQKKLLAGGIQGVLSRGAEYVKAQSEGRKNRWLRQNVVPPPPPPPPDSQTQG